MIEELVLKSKVSRSAVIKSKAVGGDGVTGGRDRPEKEGGLQVESWIIHISINIIEFQILYTRLQLLYKWSVYYWSKYGNKEFIHIETEFIRIKPL